MAMQRQRCFETERVPGAETGRNDPGAEHGFPERDGDRNRNGALHAVLAGVPGAADGARDPSELGGLDPETAHRGRTRRDGSQQCPRLGTLNGDHRPLRGHVSDRDISSRPAQR